MVRFLLSSDSLILPHTVTLVLGNFCCPPNLFVRMWHLHSFSSCSPPPLNLTVQLDNFASIWVIVD